MNVKRRNFVFGTMCLLSVLTLPVTLFGNKTGLFNGILASENPYSIVFEASKNKLAVGEINPTGYSGSGVATTELGNEVAFDYSLLINPTSNWQTILEGGFFTNINPIHGMEQITINKSDTTASVKVYWSNISIFSEGQCELFAAATDSSFTCTFDEYKPNYIKVVAIGASLKIKNMEIKFSCSDENPLEGGGSKTVLMGMYPQSKVTDATLLATLSTASGTLPTSADSQEWSDYGYYISDSVSSYMWYIDIENSGNEYRGVYFTSYRPDLTTSTSSSTYQDDNGYNTSSVYWFKYEPITWRVLDVQSSSAFLMADLVLDSQDYHYSTSNRTIGGSTVYPNNYKESHIRSWLNDNFYNTAFTAAEKARIQTTTVDNSVASTGYDPNAYACANTSDKVFLLSYSETTNASYGLSTTTARQLKPSAYAQSQGVYIAPSNGNSYWWLRSPFNYSASNARNVNRYGSVYSNYVTYTYNGVVPALWISL